MASAPPKAVFVLVHGAWHGAWTYERVTASPGDDGGGADVDIAAEQHAEDHLHQGDDRPQHGRRQQTPDGVSYDMLARIDPTKGGYDHTFAVVQPTPGDLTLHATVHEPGSGRVLDVWSTEPGLHLFTANGLNGEAPRDVGKGNVPYPSRSALCLEPMHSPDSPNQPSFPSTELAAGATYEGEIVFAFSTR
ncbi:hypothetical protein ACMHYB_06375 [Sorangium sp. So ce1128]